MEYIRDPWNNFYKEYFKKEDITPVNFLILCNGNNEVKKYGNSYDNFKISSKNF